VVETRPIHSVGVRAMAEWQTPLGEAPFKS